MNKSWVIGILGALLVITVLGSMVSQTQIPKERNSIESQKDKLQNEIKDLTEKEKLLDAKQGKTPNEDIHIKEKITDEYEVYNIEGLDSVKLLINKKDSTKRYLINIAGSIQKIEEK